MALGSNGVATTGTPIIYSQSIRIRRTHNGLSFDNVIDLQERGQIHFSELYAVRARRSVR